VNSGVEAIRQISMCWCRPETANDKCNCHANSIEKYGQPERAVIPQERKYQNAQQREAFGEPGQEK
jgi:hypothetical protein